jgi:chaperonin GroEL (HSP60 family)
VTIPAGYASKDFVTDADSGWAVLDRPAVLVCGERVETIRELLSVLERLVMSRTPLVIVAPSLAPEVLSTLEVNQIQQKMRLLAVIPKAAELPSLATACGATIMDRADLRSGWAPPDQLGRCERWVSTAKASHVIMSAEVPQNT